MDHKASSFISGQTVLGFTVVLVGVVLLLEQFDVANAGAIMRFIPSLFILLGIWQLLSNGFRHWLGPLITIGIALIFQLVILDVFEAAVFGKIWPLLLIIVGGSILLRHTRSERTLLPEKSSSSERVDVFALFGGAGRQITSPDFEGGDITVMFGAAEVDLKRMEIAAPPAVVNVFVMFGGVTFRASADTTVRTQVLAVFGNSVDERRQRKMLPDEQPELIIKGIVLFGSVNVES